MISCREVADTDHYFSYQNSILSMLPQTHHPGLAQTVKGQRKWDTFLLVTSFYPGETFIGRLGLAYASVWQVTTHRPFTFIMRDNPWLLIIPAVAVTLSVGSLTPLTYWWRAGAMYLALGIGVVLGHVFW